MQIGLDASISLREQIKGVTVDAGRRMEELPKLVLLTKYAAATKIFSASLRLLDSGHHEGATVLFRTLYELSLQASYIAQDPIPLAQKYAYFGPVSQYRRAEIFMESKDKILKDVVSESTPNMDELKQLHDLHGVDYPKNRPWHGLTNAELARKLGVEWVRDYLVMYWFQSNIAHTNPLSANSFITIGDQITLHDGPEPWDGTLGPWRATHNLLMIYNAVAIVVELEFDAITYLMRLKETVESIDAAKVENKQR